MDFLERKTLLAQKRAELENPIPDGAEVFEGVRRPVHQVEELDNNEFLDEDGDIPDNDEEILTPNSFADDLGNIIGEPQQAFVEGREPLPTDEDGNVTDSNDPD